MFGEWRLPLPALRRLWEGFWELQSDRTMRTVGGPMGAVSIDGPLSYVAISTWLDDHGFSGDRRERALRLLRVMDRCYLERLASRLTDEE